MAPQDRNWKYLFIFCLVSVLSLAIYSGETFIQPVQAFPDMGLAAYLQTYGGWAVAAVTIIALGKLYTQTSKLLEQRNQEFNECLRETTRALEAAATADRELRDTLQSVQNILRDVNQVMRVCQQRNDMYVEQDNR